MLFLSRLFRNTYIYFVEKIFDDSVTLFLRISNMREIVQLEYTNDELFSVYFIYKKEKREQTE